MEREEEEHIQSLLLEKLKYIKIVKENIGSSSVNEIYKFDPKFQYMHSMTQDLDVALPILEKVIGTTLCLQSYTLN